MSPPSNSEMGYTVTVLFLYGLWNIKCDSHSSIKSWIIASGSGSNFYIVIVAGGDDTNVVTWQKSSHIKDSFPFEATLPARRLSIRSQGSESRGRDLSRQRAAFPAKRSDWNKGTNKCSTQIFVTVALKSHLAKTKNAVEELEPETCDML